MSIDQADPARVINEITRIYAGRHGINACHVAMRWLIEQGYATPTGYLDAKLTDKGRTLAEKIIKTSGVPVLMSEF